MLRTSELEDLVRKRRNVQDLDLEWYIRVKNDVLSILMDVKNNNRESLTTERIDKLNNDIRLGKMKVELGLDYDLAKYNISVDELNTYDLQTRKILTNYIISSSKEFKILNKKVEFAKELLENRNNINKTIMDYFNKAKIIKLTRKELNTLFDKDTNDLKLIIASGRLIHEDKMDSSLDEYEFTFSKSGSFRLSAKELEKKIEQQIQECQNISQNIEQTKSDWKVATTKLVSLLETIEKEIVV